MSSALDMSLEDLIKNNKKSGAGSNFRGRGRGSGPGPTRRFSNRGSNRNTPYSKPIQAPEAVWQHDMFSDPVPSLMAPASRASAIETGTKLFISNLDYGVSNEDIKELFSEVGDLKRCSIHYDRSGRSKGMAEVVFSRRPDAMAAVKRYNNVQLDGKPMKIEIVGTNVVTPAAVPQVTNGIFGSPNGIPRSTQGRGAAMGRPRGGGSGARGWGRGGGRGRGRGGRGDQMVSALDLDAELEKYHSEAMQIN
ncbi:THO complex subunit 4A-like [Tasmannia lanceolata]|uniref:THO complex subunit 4A-like n=1 Tax=Tasmannia lanceolata TaxID=3420 RepID=UPI00406413D0